MGFRVPMIVASPWSRGGWVNSQLFDHTSTLMFLERFIEGKFGKTVREQNISAWRRAVSGDLTSVFRPYDPKETALDSLARDKFLVGIEKARFKEIPSNYRRLTAEQIEQINIAPLHSGLIPRQEEGLRPACALPYELYADGNLSEDGTHYELRLSAANQVHGAASAGAPFNVYLRHMKDGGSSGGGMLCATYAVRPGDTLTRQFPLSMFADSAYSIEVLGPNGFYRSFTGQSAPLPLSVHTSYERQGVQLTGNVQVHLLSKSAKPVSITMKDNSYKSDLVTRTIKPSEETSVVVHLQKSHGWYDFTVKADGSNNEARYAGRVETGMAGFSDPLIGQVVRAT
jgi:phospholipase C